MTKPEWGIRRICQSCGARFYDLRRSPIECPKCGTIFDPEALTKARRPRQAPAPVPVVVEKAPVVEPELVEAEEPAVEITESEEEEVIEDASELGEDEDDVAEVIENVEEQEGER
ncbi:MAG: TIGR02300 family protein [Alphaproteobacteria bacterium]